MKIIELLKPFGRHSAPGYPVYVRILTVLTVSIVASACSIDEDNSSHDCEQAIAFNLIASQSATDNNPGTKSGDGATDFSEKLVLVTEDNRVIGMSREVSNMALSDNDEKTKAVGYGSEEDFSAQEFGVYCWDMTDPSSAIYTNEKVSKRNGQWLPQTSKSWPSERTLNFEAVYPKPAFPLGDVGITNLTTDPELSGLKFSYVVPVNAGNEEDLMFACYSGTGDSGKASLAFTHALSCVKFKIGTMSGISSINSISFSGVYEKGDCCVKIADNKYSYDWSPSGTVTVSNDVKKSQLTSGTDLGTDYTFMLINQDLSANNVTLTVNMTDDNGYSFNASVILNTGKWESGKVNTYTLGTNGNIVDVTVANNVSDLTINNVLITNTGSAKEYIRATIVAGWYDEEGVMIEAWNPESGTFDGLPGVGWKLGSDGFYYFSDPVVPSTATTTPLFTSYTAPTPTSGLHLEMTIAAQAVIYDSKKVRVKAAWGENASKYLN